MSSDVRLAKPGVVLRAMFNLQLLDVRITFAVPALTGQGPLWNLAQSERPRPLTWEAKTNLLRIAALRKGARLAEFHRDSCEPAARVTAFRQAASYHLHRAGVG
jgi:hypothetical protein